MIVVHDSDHADEGSGAIAWGVRTSIWWSQVDHHEWKVGMG